MATQGGPERPANPQGGHTMTCGSALYADAASIGTGMAPNDPNCPPMGQMGSENEQILHGDVPMAATSQFPHPMMPFLGTGPQSGLLFSSFGSISSSDSHSASFSPYGSTLQFTSDMSNPVFFPTRESISGQKNASSTFSGERQTHKRHLGQENVHGEGSGTSKIPIQPPLGPESGKNVPGTPLSGEEKNPPKAQKVDSSSSQGENTPEGPKIAPTDPENAQPDPKSATTGPKSAPTDPKNAQTDPKSAPTGPKSTQPDPKSTQPDPKSTQPDPKGAQTDTKGATKTGAPSFSQNLDPQNMVRNPSVGSLAHLSGFQLSDARGGRQMSVLPSPNMVIPGSQNVAFRGPQDLDSQNDVPDQPENVSLAMSLGSQLAGTQGSRRSYKVTPILGFGSLSPLPPTSNFAFRGFGEVISGPMQTMTHGRYRPDGKQREASLGLPRAGNQSMALPPLPALKKARWSRE